MKTEATLCIALEHVSANSTYHTFRVAFHSATSRMLLPYPQVTGIRILDESGIKVGEWRTRVIGSVPVDDFVLAPKARIAFDLMAFVNCEPTPVRRWSIELPIGKHFAKFVYQISRECDWYDYLAKRSRFAHMTPPWNGTVESNTIEFLNEIPKADA